MLDLRQHLFYVIAIFLMLGFGIVLGASFYGPVQVKQQQKSLASLRVQVDGAVQEGRAAKAQLAQTEAALDASRPMLVRGKLTGKRIIIVQTGDYADAVQSAAAALRDAGATPAAVVTLDSKWALLTSDARASALASLTAALANGTANAARAQALQGLEDQGLVVVTGSLDTPCLLFVLVGGGQQDVGIDDTVAAALDIGLVQGLQEASGPTATLVGCEPYGADLSSIPTFQQARISTVDCIDRPLGQLALPFALRGGLDAGDYGMKATATRQFPPSLEVSAR